MLGRLDYSALPFYSMVAFGGAAFTVFMALLVVGLITYFKGWGWLWHNYLTTVDHKRIGVMYIVVALVMLVRGFCDAIMMRAQQMMSAHGGTGYLEGDHFQQVFSSHGTIMIFFVAMPFMTGLINFVLPLQLGARDVAFPRLNALSFWLTVAGAGLVLISLVLGKFSTAGWTGYPPLSGIAASPGVGVDYWLWAVWIAGWGSSLSAINFLVTIMRRRAPGMTFMRMTVFVWTVFFASIIMVIAFPPLTAVTSLLMLDRLFGMHFFTADLGGNFMNFANLIWMWGHPEVYILVLPAFGVFSEVTATFCRKPLFGYKAMVYATAVITLVSMLVWLHHFFTMGASATVNAVFGIATMIIGIPTGLKIFNWMFTLYKGKVEYEVPMLWLLGFIVLFVIGGMTGVMHSIVPIDYNLHNTTFLVAHFHNMIIPGVLFGYLAGYYYWFPKAMGFRLDPRWGRASFFCWFFGFIFAFMPLYALGMMAMPRRTADVQDPSFAPLLNLAFFGACLIFCGIVAIIGQLIVSIRHRARLRDATGDPWNGRTLEWSTPSPPPQFDFARIPIVESLDALAYAKEHGGMKYGPVEPIRMPNRTPVGLFIGVFAFLAGFGMVWYIWWLAALSFVALIAYAIAHTFNYDRDTFIPVEAVAHAEAERSRLLAEGA